MTRAVILLNLGTPAEPTAKGLRDFYRYFFADPYVFDINPVGRWLLRNLIIQPFRAPRTARDYETIWMEDGSPLKVYSDRLQQDLQSRFADEDADVLVVNGMAYSAPMIHDSMAVLREQGIRDILVVPLFPQYSTATTASVFHGVKEAAGQWGEAPRLEFVNDLYDEASFIRAWGKLITRHIADGEIDHLVFSYHGLPESNLRKADSSNTCRFDSCCDQITDSNRLCYRAQCFATTRSIMEHLDLPAENHSVAFQSRFGRQEWIKPYLEQHLQDLLAQGKKRVAVATPSFVSDCLETLHEIGVEYREGFIEAGGEELLLIPNLNDEPAWFDAVYQIASSKLKERFGEG